MGHNEEKGKLPKESLIIEKHKYLRLRQKLVTGRTNVQSSPKSYQDATRAEYNGKGKLRPKRYSTKKYWKRRQLCRKPPKYWNIS